MNTQAAQKTSPNAAIAATFEGNFALPTELAIMNHEDRQDFLRACNPANMRYLSAIRGYVPAQQSEGFTYAMLGCGNGDTLMALAAANPEGMFFGFDADVDALEVAAAHAAEWQVENVKFAVADAATLSEAVKTGALQPSFDYVIANLIDRPDAIAETIAAAQSLLAEGGLCYIAYSSGIAAAAPATFIPTYKAGTTNVDKAFAAANGMAYVGSAKIKHNYIELSVSEEQHDALLAHDGKPGYESVKAAAMGAVLRHDVWVKPGLSQSQSEVLRFQNFIFGTTSPMRQIDPNYRYFDKKIDLATPLFTRLLASLGRMPHTIGDLVTMPEMLGLSEAEVVGGLQTLVAIGLVEPVRSVHKMEAGNYEHPILSTSFNQRLRGVTIEAGGTLLAAPTIGRPLLATAPMAMTLQAFDQGGIPQAEAVLADALANAPAGVKSMFPAGKLDTEESRTNLAFHLLEDCVNDWLLFCYVQGVMQPTV